MTVSMHPFGNWGGRGLEWECNTGNKDHLADFPLSGLGFKGCILIVGGEEKQQEVGGSGALGQW